MCPIGRLRLNLFEDTRLPLCPAAPCASILSSCASALLRFSFLLPLYCRAMKRREFLEVTGLAGAGALMAPGASLLASGAAAFDPAASTPLPICER